MRNLIFALFLLFIGLVGVGQNRQEADSLKHQLAIAKHDTSRVLLLVELAELYQNANPDLALTYAQQALSLTQKINFLRGQSRAFRMLGIINNVLGNVPQGFDWVFKGLQIAEENNFPLEAAYCYNNLGFFYSSSLPDAPKAMEYFRRGLAINKKAPNSKEKWEKEAQIFRNIGRIYHENKQIDSATYYYQKAVRIQQENNLEITSTQINNLGRIAFLQGHPKKAMEYSRRAIQICIKRNDHRFASIIYNTLATYFKASNQSDSAIYYSKIGLAEAQSIGFKSGMRTNSQLLADLYESKDLKKAYEYQKISIAANEELNGIKKIRSLQKTITDELLHQRTLEAERVAYQNRLKLYGLLAGLGVVLLISFILYYNNRQQKRANQLLRRQKQEIDHQKANVEKALSELKTTQDQLIQKEKLASLGELTAGIAHEIQNPLNFVNNFSELSVELVDELKSPLTPSGGIKEGERVDIELLEDIVQNLEKINHHGKRASSIVKGMLEHSRTSTGERALTDINKLADEYLRLSYHGLRAKDKDFNAELITEFDENLPKIEVVPQDIGRVLLNLMNNAFYAVNERVTQGESGYQAKVTVSTRAEGNYLEIRVSDNGNGIPKENLAKIFQPFFTTKPTGEGTGLGLSLSYDIITKGHGGTLEVKSVEGEGATFTIKLNHEKTK